MTIEVEVSSRTEVTISVRQCAIGDTYIDAIERAVALVLVRDHPILFIFGKKVEPAVAIVIDPRHAFAIHLTAS